MTSPYISNLSIKSKLTAPITAYTAKVNVTTEPVNGGSCFWYAEPASCGMSGSGSRLIISCDSIYLFSGPTE